MERFGNKTTEVSKIWKFPAKSDYGHNKGFSLRKIERLTNMLQNEEIQLKYIHSGKYNRAGSGVADNFIYYFRRLRKAFDFAHRRRWSRIGQEKGKLAINCSTGKNKTGVEKWTVARQAAKDRTRWRKNITD